MDFIIGITQTYQSFLRPISMFPIIKQQISLIIQMFQNSFLNRVAVKCADHPRSSITHICTDSRCEAAPLFCEECISHFRFKEKHYSHELRVMEIGAGLQEISKRIQNDKRPISSIYKEVLTHKSTEGLLKWQGEKQQHFESIDKHLKTIKFQIGEQMVVLVKKFEQQLQAQKTIVFSQLDQFYKNYRQKFEKFSSMAEPIVQMNNQFKFYSSKNALTFKISSELDQSKLKDWLIDLKKTLAVTERAARDPSEFAAQIKQYGQAANGIIDELPRIRNVDYQVQLPSILASTVKQILRSLVKLREVRATTVCRSISMNAIPSEGQKWRNGIHM